jgi:hypothetical protein
MNLSTQQQGLSIPKQTQVLKKTTIALEAYESNEKDVIFVQTIDNGLQYHSDALRNYKGVPVHWRFVPSKVEHDALKTMIGKKINIEHDRSKIVGEVVDGFVDSWGIKTPIGKREPSFKSTFKVKLDTSKISVYEALQYGGFSSEFEYDIDDAEVKTGINGSEEYTLCIPSIRFVGGALTKSPRSDETTIFNSDENNLQKEEKKLDNNELNKNKELISYTNMDENKIKELVNSAMEDRFPKLMNSYQEEQEKEKLANEEAQKKEEEMQNIRNSINELADIKNSLASLTEKVENMCQAKNSEEEKTKEDNSDDQEDDKPKDMVTNSKQNTLHNAKATLIVDFSK